MTTMRPPASEQKVNSPAYRSGIFLLLVAIGLALYWHTQEPSVSAGHLPAHTGAKSTAKDGQYDRPGGEQQAFCSCGSRAEDDEGLAFLQLEGTVEDCCCDYSSITKMNRDVIRPALEPVVKEPFFRYYQVDLACDCGLWPEDGMCAMKECSVCECSPEELSAEDLVDTPTHSDLGAECPECAGCGQDSVVLRPDSQEALFSDQGLAMTAWTDQDPWSLPTRPDDMTYINLLDNPERFTGYVGEHAHRVWATIYNQGCLKSMAFPGFEPSQEHCAEYRILYRLISGIHTSIGIHIARDYKHDLEDDDSWGPAPQLFWERYGNTQQRTRLTNLYFVFSFVHRAISKGAETILQTIQTTEGNRESSRQAQNRTTLALLRPFFQALRDHPSCVSPFNEATAWSAGADSDALLQELQETFQGITRVMDCVGCEKCKLWGKLQIQGLGAALKIVLADEPARDSHLGRNEVVALVNLYHRLSESIEAVPALARGAVRSQDRVGTVG